MTSRNLLRIALASALACCSLAVAAASASAPAKGMGSHQNYHCKQADGSMDMGKTKKACLAAKGTWAKDDASTTAPAASAAPKK
jgi:Spy/CpxP family protein refolding chaperone